VDSANNKTEPARVRRRHVVYVQGYDPRGLAEYYRMFRSEYRKFCALYGLTGTIGKLADATDHFTATWPLVTTGNGWQVDTTYQFLRWEDIIRGDFAQPIWWKIFHGLVTFFWLIRQGTLAAFTRHNWRFTGFVAYAYVVLISHVLVAALCGVAAGYLVGAILSFPYLPLLAGLAAFATVVTLLVTRTEQQTYMLYMFNDIIATFRYANRRRPDWEERFELFAHYLVAAVKSTNADEVIVIGHSSGSFIAIDVLTRALAHDPELGRHGPRVALMTVGSNIPTAGFHPASGWYRERLARIAVEPAIDWVDYQSRKDIMNFFAFDPIRGHGIELGAARRNPTVVPVRFRDIVKPENYPRFRWRFFRLHFQFLMANERLGAAYDYFMICCGPFDLMTRATRPDAVVAAVAPKNPLPAPIRPPDDDTAA
jgi:pimeloyl-ACP methyl ester carboxylesterase